MDSQNIQMTSLEDHQQYFWTINSIRAYFPNTKRNNALIYKGKSFGSKKSCIKKTSSTNNTVDGRNPKQPPGMVKTL